MLPPALAGPTPFRIPIERALAVALPWRARNLALDLRMVVVLSALSEIEG